jgi:Undecaprenyl-phosphate galactose phosphotransferase WbaP
VGVIYQLRAVIWGDIPLFWGLWTTGVGWIIFRAASELYNPFGLYPPEELRRSFRTTAGAFIIHLAILLSADATEPWRLAGLGVWPLVLPLAYILRTSVRGALARRGRYGVPMIVIGSGEKARRAVRELIARPENGYVPVGIFTYGPAGEESAIEGIPIMGNVTDALALDVNFKLERALIALSHREANPDELLSLWRKLAPRYPILQIFSDLTGRSSHLARLKPIGAYQALEMIYRRFSARQRRMKRAVDLAVGVPALIAAAPLIAVAALLVRIKDPGPAFFAQLREGRGGAPIRIWKIRTMVQNAEARLAEHLNNDQAARFEYERTLKLRNDPRVIPTVGRFLRRYSIDELPQLWSIVKGDLSLVGPRVMLAHEVDRFSPEGQRLRRDVPPGLTGFWQVEHRNNSDLNIWEVADSFYVTNWSIWLDMWIILRTFRVVITGAGAY